MRFFCHQPTLIALCLYREKTNTLFPFWVRKLHLLSKKTLTLVILSIFKRGLEWTYSLKSHSKIIQNTLFQPENCMLSATTNLWIQRETFTWGKLSPSLKIWSEGKWWSSKKAWWRLTQVKKLSGERSLRLSLASLAWTVEIKQHTCRTPELTKLRGP